MAPEERTYVIPLRKQFLRAPIYKRTKRAVTAVRAFITHHMKADEVHMGQHLNEQLWARGNRHPPARIEVHTKKEENVAYVELVGKEFPAKKVVDKKAGEKKTKKELTEVEKEEKLTTTPGAVVTESKAGTPRPSRASSSDKRNTEKMRSEKMITISGK